MKTVFDVSEQKSEVKCWLKELQNHFIEYAITEEEQNFFSIEKCEKLLGSLKRLEFEDDFKNCYQSFILQSEYFENYFELKSELIEFLKKTFNDVFIRYDEHSLVISGELYKKINLIENKMRYIMDKTLIKKINRNYLKTLSYKPQRIKELSLLKYDAKNLRIDTSILYFDELLDLLNKNFERLDINILLTTEYNETKKKIDKIDPSLMKEFPQFETLWQKYFGHLSEIDNDFQTKWKEIARIRNDIAHNKFVLLKKESLSSNNELIESVLEQLDKVIKSSPDEDFDFLEYLEKLYAYKEDGVELQSKELLNLALEEAGIITLNKNYDRLKFIENQFNSEFKNSFNQILQDIYDLLTSLIEDDRFDFQSLEEASFEQIFDGEKIEFTDYFGNAFSISLNSENCDYKHEPGTDLFYEVTLKHKFSYDFALYFENKKSNDLNNGFPSNIDSNQNENSLITHITLHLGDFEEVDSLNEPLSENNVEFQNEEFLLQYLEDYKEFIKQKIKKMEER